MTVAEPAGDPVAVTRATYDAVAGAYEARWRRRDSAAERSWLHDAVLKELEPGSVVLDLGCGPGRDGQRLAAAGLVVLGGDLSAGMLRLASARLPGRVAAMDMRALPVGAGRLDGVWSVAALLHVPREQTGPVLAGLARVVRPGGVLALCTSGRVPGAAGDALGGEQFFEEASFAAGGHLRWYVNRTGEELLTALDRAGFDVISHREQVTHRAWHEVLCRRR